MQHVGMDLGKKESQIAILTEAGELIEKRMRTERDRLVAYFKDRPKAKILIEASTISEWVARLLEELGHQVVVADPNYAPMYAQRSRRVKTDKRDALALAEACRLGAYRPAHRTSALDEPTCEEGPEHPFDHRTQRAVRLGEPLLVHAQKLLEVLLNQTEKRRVPSPPRPVDPTDDLHTSRPAGGRATGEKRPSYPRAKGGWGVCTGGASGQVPLRRLPSRERVQPMG